MQGVRRTPEELLKAFASILKDDPEIAQNTYDRLPPSLQKPGRKNLIEKFGSWEEAKKLAFALLGHTAQKPETPEPESASHEEGGEEEQLASRSYLAEQNNRLSRELEKQKRLNQVFVENCLASIEKLAIRPLSVPKHQCSQENLEFHALRSDAQVGQKTDPRAVQGLSVYNAEVYKERVQRWTEKVLTFREQDCGSLGLNRLVVSHLGDQVEGESIYPGQPFHLDLHLTDQLFYSVEVESAAILALAQEFPEVEIFAVAGNHGRVGKKGDHSGSINVDYLFYRALKTALSRQPNIKMYVSESPSLLVRHGEFHFLLNHGDNAKGWNGIPFYGLERAFRRLHDLYGIRIDVELVGHHHQQANLSDRVVINGCLPGGSDLSINRMGLASVPSQKVFYFHPHHGLNRESNLRLADTPTLTADANGIYTAVV